MEMQVVDHVLDLLLLLHPLANQMMIGELQVIHQLLRPHLVLALVPLRVMIGEQQQILGHRVAVNQLHQEHQLRPHLVQLVARMIGELQQILGHHRVAVNQLHHGLPQLQLVETIGLQLLMLGLVLQLPKLDRHQLLEKLTIGVALIPLQVVAEVGLLEVEAGLVLK